MIFAKKTGKVIIKESVMQITRHKNSVMLVKCKYYTKTTLILHQYTYRFFSFVYFRTIQEDAVLEALCEMTNIEPEKANSKIMKAGIIGLLSERTEQ